jgi:hypothetical protein
MLASYLTDIEQLLDEQRWDAALRDAAELPRIAVALGDPLMRASSEDVAQWCVRWVAPGHTGEAGVQTFSDRAGDPTPLQVHPGGATPEVPTRALRRLQLRRHARATPRGFLLDADEDLEPHATEALQTVRALVDGTRRWYARSGVHDPSVQSNLARLAVLR